MIDKKTLRKNLLAYRKLLSDQEFNRRNQVILDKVNSLIRKEGFKTFHTFLPIKSNREFDITPILPELYDRGVQIVISKSDFEEKTMEHFLWTPSTFLKENKLGIPEPINAESISFEQVDLVLVPLLAADKKGNRIGYGGGFYDRLLQNFEGHSVGICLTTLFDELGTDDWDVPVKQVLFFDGKSHNG